MASKYCNRVSRCNKNWWCATDYNPERDHYECFDQMSNADHIRAMSDEELAEWLSKTRAMWECRPKADKARRGRCDANECDKCWFAWLQRAALGGDGVVGRRPPAPSMGAPVSRTGNLGYDENQPENLYCMKCKTIVARRRDYAGDATGPLGGEWKGASE